MPTTYYSEDHEWIEVDGDAGTVGITDFAQEQLGDVVFVELPEIGRIVIKGDDMAVVESVKAASEVYAPVGGEVIAVNDALEDNPAVVNEEAESDGWFVRLRLADAAELEDLMDAEAYAAFAEAQS
ncbi:MAG: glycine cleavage system protein GcvH [Rhodospirillaceae bacterium]|nr:glycine cleavage system protein GcvH [Rhodospirillaceae bacterium]